MNKEKLTIKEQGDYLEKLGIKFDIYSKQKALDFLTHHNYFFKIKSYTKNYEKHNTKYTNLDFAYLVEFSTLDMHLRRLILELSLDIEHLLKVALNAHFSDNTRENGYDIVSNFLKDNERIANTIKEASKRVSFIKNVAQKYQEKPALWNFIELLSFGDFLQFYKYYFIQYPHKEYEKLHSLAYCVKTLRNGAAHNSCMLNTLKIHYDLDFTPSKNIQTFVATIPNISENTRKKILANPLLHDCITTIWLFTRLCKSKQMQRAKKRIIVKFLRRCVKHREYFESENFLHARFVAMKKIVFFLLFKQNIRQNIR